MIPSRVTPSNHAQARIRRGRLRKGTHSCWECKRRKMKCVFESTTNGATCNGCRRRGSQCISQEFPEKVSLPVEKTYETHEGDERVDLLHADGDGIIWNVRTSTMPVESSRMAEDGLVASVSMTPGPSRHPAFDELSKVCSPLVDIVMIATDCSHQHRTVEGGILEFDAHPPGSQGQLERLARFLHDSLPSREITKRICKASPRPYVLAHEIMTMPYTSLVQTELEKPESLLEVPEPNLHPVLIARHMLLLASFLQHLHPDLHEEIQGLPESPQTMSKRLADLAINLVATKDELLDSIEGLECVVIESVYQANLGHLRRSWIAGRRAVSIAQLMGLHRLDNRTQYNVLDPKTRYHPQIMWFRIVFLDRFFCLMQGLPQGCIDRSVASEAMLTKDVPMERLERTHCVVASRILERNELDSSSTDLALTRTLDQELQKAARSLPSKWWLAPKLNSAPSGSQTLFWNIRRLFAQVLHYNLLNQLHLPYMFRSSPAERRYEYSQVTCINASRDVLLRVVTLRSLNRIDYSCRIVDFLALMASITLLLAHLDCHVSGAENSLAHQYHSDRALIEQVQENMREVNRWNAEALSVRSADLVDRLLAIELESTDGRPHCAMKVKVHGAHTEIAPPDQDDDAAVSVHIPYFGIIKMIRNSEGTEGSERPSTTMTTSNEAQAQVLDNCSPASTRIAHIDPQIHPSGLAGSSGVPGLEDATLVDLDCGHVDTLAGASDAFAMTQAQLGTFSVPTAGDNDIAPHLASQSHNDLTLYSLQDEEYFRLNAGDDDWAFQNVDLAFLAT